MSTPPDSSSQADQPDSIPVPLVNSLYYLDSIAYVLDAAKAGMSREEILQGLLLFTISHRGWPPGGDYGGFYEGVMDAVASGVIRPEHPGILFRPYGVKPTGLFSRILEGVERKMRMLPDAVGTYDINGYHRRK